MVVTTAPNTAPKQRKCSMWFKNGKAKDAVLRRGRQGLCDIPVRLQRRGGQQIQQERCDSLLCTSLQGQPLDLMKGIGTDYDATWSYLDSVYSDPRFVADTITQDITKFRPLRDGEDARFCDLVHLVQRHFTTLKEVG